MQNIPEVIDEFNLASIIDSMLDILNELRDVAPVYNDLLNQICQRLLVLKQLDQNQPVVKRDSIYVMTEEQKLALSQLVEKRVIRAGFENFEYTRSLLRELTASVVDGVDKENHNITVKSLILRCEVYHVWLHDVFNHCYLSDQPLQLIKRDGSEVDPVTVSATYSEAIDKLNLYSLAVACSHRSPAELQRLLKNHARTLSKLGAGYNYYCEVILQYQEDSEKIMRHLTELSQDGRAKLEAAAEMGHPQALSYIGRAKVSGQFQYGHFFDPEYPQDLALGIPMLIAAAKHFQDHHAIDFLVEHYLWTGDIPQFLYWLEQSCQLGLKNIVPMNLYTVLAKGYVNNWDQQILKPYDPQIQALAERMIGLLTKQPSLQVISQNSNFAKVQSSELISAIENADLVKVRALLRADVDPNSGLALAARLGLYDIMVALLEFGADINDPKCNAFKENCYGVTYHQDCPSESVVNKRIKQDDRLRIAKLLIDNGYDINRPFQSGLAPLHVAVLNDNPVLLELLLNQPNCVVDITDSYGETPLQIAVHAKNEVLVRLLIRAGAAIHVDPNASKTMQLLLAAYAKARHKHGIVYEQWSQLLQRMQHINNDTQCSDDEMHYPAESESVQQYDAAKALFQQQQYDATIEVLNSLIDELPKPSVELAKCYMLRAFCLRDQKQFERAMADYESVMKINILNNTDLTVIKSKYSRIIRIADYDLSVLYQRCLQRQAEQNPKLLIAMLDCIASIYTQKPGRDFAVLLECEKLRLACYRELGDIEKAIFACEMVTYLHRGCRQFDVEGLEQLEKMHQELIAAREQSIGSPHL